MPRIKILFVYSTNSRIDRECCVLYMYWYGHCTNVQLYSNKTSSSAEIRSVRGTKKI